MAEQKNRNANLNMEEALSKSEAFINKYKNALIGAVVAIIVIIAGIMLYKNQYVIPREERAQAAIFKGQDYFEQDAFEWALNGDSIEYYGFLSVMDEFKGTKAAKLARVYAGICYAKLGQYDQAIDMLDGYNAGDQLVSPAVTGLIGNCYAELGELDKAASTLVAAADKGDNTTLSPIYLMQAGELYMELGKYDQAIEVYTKIKDKYFQSYQAMSINKYIERAELMKE